MRRRFAILFLASILAARALLPDPLDATACSLDAVPGATLLLPYFEVDLQLPDGLTTLFSIANASSAAILTNVTLWTDHGIPTLHFPVYLTGFDVTTVNLRDIFEGRLPSSAAGGQDPSDLISPRGQLSQDLEFASCAGVLPPARLSTAERADLRAEHSGRPSNRLAGLCAAVAQAVERPRGFVTVDTVNSCTRRFPSDAGYFGFAGDATAQNALWGDFVYVDGSQDLAQGDALVRIEAFPGRFQVGQSTFYGWLHQNSGIDQREPLATSWANRFLVGGAFTGGTEILMWRAPASRPAPFACPPSPPPPALGPESLVIFDEQENPEVPICMFWPLCSVLDFFPFVANRVTVDGSSLPVPFNFGWFFLQDGQSPARQRWTGTLISASARFGVGFAGAPLDSACGAAACLPGQCP
jgi:hypothetical protein